MSKENEAIKRWVEVFDGNWHDEPVDSEWADRAHQALAEMRQAIAEAEQPAQQEPVGEVVQAFADLTAISWKHNGGRFPPIGTKLYTAPQPQSSKPWVGLTDEEVINVMPDDDNPMSLGEAFCKFAVLLEAKLKEKNT